MRLLYSLEAGSCGVGSFFFHGVAPDRFRIVIKAALNGFRELWRSRRRKRRRRRGRRRGRRGRRRGRKERQHEVRKGIC